MNKPIIIKKQNQYTDINEAVELSKFAGLESVAKDFIPFEIVKYKRDPEYGYENVYLMLIKFPGEEKDEQRQYGICIYDTAKKEFIEEPGDLNDYDTTLEKIAKKYGF